MNQATTVAVAVVGSANLDLVVHVPRRPAPGETLFGTSYSEHPGGKGLNQATAAAQHTPTALVGHHGDDTAGSLLLTHLARHDVDATHFTTTPGPSGQAHITVTPDGENSIIVLPHANNALTGDQVTTALDALAPAVVLTQLEVPPAAVAAAARWAQAHHARLLVNASPTGPVPQQVLAAADPLIVNEGEAQFLADTHDTDQAAQRLARTCRSVVVTLGARGALVLANGTTTPVAAPATRPLDTTGAGDTFAGALAAHLARGTSLTAAAQLATHQAADLIQIPRSER